MSEAEVKRALVRLMGDVLDETTLPGLDSFVEMSADVIHCAVHGRDWYFRVVLEAVEEAGP